MSFSEDELSSLCQEALHIVAELCFAGQVEWEKCSGIFPPDKANRGGDNTDISISLLAVIVTFCGLALVVVSFFVFWKLCWPSWRSKLLTSNIGTLPQSISSAPVLEINEKEEKNENMKVSPKIESAMKISHTSPDIPTEVQNALKEHLIKHEPVQRQTTEPTSSSRILRLALRLEMPISGSIFNHFTVKEIQSRSRRSSFKVLSQTQLLFWMQHVSSLPYLRERERERKKKKGRRKKGQRERQRQTETERQGRGEEEEERWKMKKAPSGFGMLP
uniref:Solute carrier family 2 member 13 n=1 Tax=Monodelphis domestica TaxID=13616 RepID=A0A5F8GCH7_MONDO